LPILLWTLCPTLVAAEIPDGFEVVQITADPNLERGVRLNACGEIVLAKWFGQTGDLAEIFLYDNGATLRLTDNAVADVLPNINEFGHVVWTHALDEFDNGTVAFYDGQSTRFMAEGYAPRLNDHDQMAWIRRWNAGCRLGDADIYFYDGEIVSRLTSEGSNQSPELDNNGRMVWTRYDFCPQRWTSQIILFEDGKEIILPSKGPEPRVPVINDALQVAWGGNGIELWQDGVTQWLARDGAVPRLNAQGDIAFVLWSDERQTWDAWLYQEGQLIELTHMEQENLWVPQVDISNWGEVVWGTFDIMSLEGDLFYMRRMRSGESDFDGDVDLDDAASLHDCLTGPGDFDRLCDCRFLDIDHDRDVDLGDFVLFQRNYTGSK
jgi:hypothetical protein